MYQTFFNNKHVVRILHFGTEIKRMNIFHLYAQETRRKIKGMLLTVWVNYPV